MDALTISPRSSFKHRLKRNDYEPIPSRYMAVLSHHLAGRSARQIVELTGYKLPTIYKILSDQRVTQIRQQLLAHTQAEFEALYPKVVEVIRTSLDSNDASVKLKASDQWLHASGKYKGDTTTQINVTAEDVVFQILNQGSQDAGA
jgi:hypothetical protein